MNFYKKRKHFISLVCAISLILSMLSVAVAAVDVNSVTATTDATVKQGNYAYCYVNIDSTEGLAALDVTVHYDPAKVNITNVYNSVSCTLYDSVINSDNIRFSYILDGKGTATKTRLFYFRYQVLSDAVVGEAYFNITIGEAYDNALNEVPVSGSRCGFTVAEKVTSKSCTVYSSSSVSTAIEQEFTLSYRFSTYQIASGTAVISYDPDLFELVGVTNGAFLTDKVVDVNTALTGEIYISFVGIEYYSSTNLASVTFRTIKNVTETASITFKSTELIDKELNAYSCSGCTTTVQVAHDDSYIGDAPKMSVLTECDEQAEKVYATIFLEDNAHLGAGDFSLTFDPSVLTLSSYEQKVSADFFLINDKELPDGVFKFSIISLTDIDTACQMIQLVFDVAHVCEPQALPMDLSGSMMVDSLTNTIPLNLIDGNVMLSDGWVKGHVYTSLVTKQPDCTAIGVETYTCSACGDSYTENIAALGHTYDNACDTDCNRCGAMREITHTYESVVTPPDCENGGYTTHTCLVCGDIYIDAPTTALGHNYEVVVTASSCTVDGQKVYTCSNCGDSYNESIAALGHSWVFATCIASKTCSICGTTEGDELGHTYDNACDTDCNRCGEMRSVGPHAYESVISIQATCAAEGLLTYICEYCSVSYTEVIPATGKHTYDNDCDADCNDCGSIRIPSAHVYDNDCDVFCNSCDAARFIEHAYEAVSIVRPDCVNEGYITYTCSVCGDTYEADRTAALGHDYKVVVTPPNCENEGFTTHTCQNCGDSYISDNTAALGHDYKVVVTPPSCENEGYTTRSCQNCGDSYISDSTATLGHNYVGVETEAPTCTIDGSVTYTCSVCGNSYTEIAPATGKHTMVFEPAKFATCAEYGHIDYWWCSDCECMWLDAECTIITNVKYVVIPATGKHTYDNACDDSCNVCGSTRVPSDHMYEAEITTAPTCGSDGIKTYTCSVCGDSYIEAIAATGNHAYDNDCATDCSVCGAMRTFEMATSIVFDDRAKRTELTSEIQIWEEEGLVVTNNKYQANSNVADYVKPARFYKNSELIITYPGIIQITFVCNNATYANNLAKAIGDTAFVSDVYVVVYLDEVDSFVCTLTAGQVRMDSIHVFAKAPYVPTHTYDNACDDSCNVCDSTRVPSDHVYEAEITTAPTCGSDSIKTYTCSVCGDSYIEAIAATGNHAYDNDCDSDCNTCGSVRVVLHRYSNDFDVDCDDCGAVREVVIPISFGGNSTHENVSGLAFRFDVAVQGMERENAIAIYDNATVNGYKLLSMGAIVTNGFDTRDVPAVYLCGLKDDTASFAVRIIEIPNFAYNYDITATPYIILEIDGVVTTIYGEAHTASYNGALA